MGSERGMKPKDWTLSGPSTLKWSRGKDMEKEAKMPVWNHQQDYREKPTSTAIVLGSLTTQWVMCVFPFSLAEQLLE